MIRKLYKSSPSTYTFPGMPGVAWWRYMALDTTVRSENGLLPVRYLVITVILNAELLPIEPSKTNVSEIQ